MEIYCLLMGYIWAQQVEHHMPDIYQGWKRAFAEAWCFVTALFWPATLAVRLVQRLCES